MSSNKMSFWQRLGLILAIAFIAWVIIHSIIKYFKNLVLEVRKIHSEVRALWQERLLIKEKRIKLKRVSKYVSYIAKALTFILFYVSAIALSNKNDSVIDAVIKLAELIGLLYLSITVFFRWKMYKLNECLDIVERKIEEATYRLGGADDRRIDFIQLTINLKLQRVSALKEQLIFRKIGRPTHRKGL